MTVTGIDWNHTDNYIATSGQDRNAYVWKYEQNEWKPTLVILRIGRAATCIKWSPNGKKFAVGSSSKQIPVCHYEASQDMWVAKMVKKGPKSTVLCVDWSPNNAFIIAGSCDFKCRIYSGYIPEVDKDVTKIDESYSQVWDGDKCTDFGVLLSEFDQSRGWIEACRFSPSGMSFAFAGHDSTVHFGEIKDGKVDVQSILRRDLPIRAIVFLTDNLAVGGGYDNVPIVYENKGGRWEETGPLDKGKTTGKVVQKTAFDSSLGKFENTGKLGKASATDDIALPFRHQNIINDIVVYAEDKFTTSSVDGRILHWNIKQSY